MSMQQTLVVAFSQAALERRRRQLLRNRRGCLLGFKFQTLRGLALELVQEQRGRQQLLELSATNKLLREALGLIIHKEDKDQSVWLTDGALRQIGETIAQIKLRGNPADPPADLSANGRIVLNTKDKYQELLEGHLDDADAMTEAIGLIQGGNRCLSLRSTAIELVGADNEMILEPWEIKLFQALQEHCGAKPVSEPTTPATSAVFEVMTGESTVMPDRVDNIVFQQAPTPEIERRVLGRSLRWRLANTTVSPEDILILHPNNQNVVHNLVRVLDEYELPHDGMLAVSMTEMPLIEFVLKFAELDAGNFTWQDWLWFGSSPFATREGKGLDSGNGLGKLARLLATYKLRSGSLEKWSEAWDGLEEALEAECDLLRQRIDKDDDAAQKLQRTEHDQKRIIESKAYFKAMLPKVKKSLLPRQSRPPAQWVVAFNQSLDNLGIAAKFNATAATEDLLAEERASWGALRAALRELQASAEQPPEETKEDFLVRLRSELGRRSACDQQRYASCISLRTPERLERGNWKWVFVVGCNAGDLPAQAKEGGILTDADRQMLGLPTSKDQNNDSSKLLQRALTLNQPERLTISHTQRGSDGKPSMASPFLQRLDDALAVWQGDKRYSVFYHGTSAADAVTHSNLSAPWCKTFRLEDLLATNKTVALPAEKVITDRLNNVPLPGEAVASAVAGDGAAAYWNEDNWTAQAQTPQTRFGTFSEDEWKKHVLRPSALDAYAQCPYKYFAQCVLGLEALAELELAPDPLTVGTTMHEILESVVQEWIKEKKDFTAKDDADYAAKQKELSERIAELAKTRFGKLAKSSAMSFPTHLVVSLGDRWAKTLRETIVPKLLKKPVDHNDWLQKVEANRPKKALSNEAEELLAQIKAAYFNDLPLTKPDNWPDGTKGFFNSVWKLIENRPLFFTPVALEWAFATSKTPLEIQFDNLTIRLAGTIDRVDVCAYEGQPALVRLLDYKTSKLRNMSSAKDLKEGKALQLAAYAVAFDEKKRRNELPSPSPEDILKDAQIQQLTLFTVRTGAEKTVPDSKNPIPDLVAHCRKLIVDAAQAIHDGKLAPLPRKGCPVGGQGFCKFADLCRARQIPQRWLNKGYAALPAVASTSPEEGK